MNESIHVLGLLSDYVLDLLPGYERQRVEAHAAVCLSCRQALQRERAVGMAVRDTLTTVHHSAIGGSGAAGSSSNLTLDLRRQRPPLPRRPFMWARLFNAQKPLATLCILLLVLFGSLTWRPGGSTPVWSAPSATAVAATATATETPTATITGTATAISQNTGSVVNSYLQPTSEVSGVVLPRPLPTPFVAVGRLVSP